ncbi:toll-like receptor 4 [Engraulis encrasicolus]|uniref:toll-like receptor 4 n=1 Tax=Engraulis encrasicolus TaxID=184585 RepID=UPI002FD5AB40
MMKGTGLREACVEIIPGLQYSCYRRNLTYVPASIPSTTEHLDFSFNYLNTLQRGVLPSLPSLVHLDLTRCNIQHIYSDAFITTRNLSILILTGNPIRCLGKHSFNILTRMQKLVLVDTALSSLDSLNLQNATSLRELQVGRNNIFSIALPMYAVSFKDFAVLDLHSNNISVIRAVHTSVLRALGTNISLILYSNPISFIEAGTFYGLYLKQLDVIDTFTSSAIMRNAIGNLSGLSVKTLRIGGFLISSESLIHTDSLDKLCVIQFQEIFFYQPTYEEVALNLLEHFPLNYLEEIILVRGKLARLLGPLLSHQNRLRKLVINHNARVIPSFLNIEDLPSLEYVDLSDNGLIMPCCDYEFIGTPNLQYLNLSMNAMVRFRSQGLSSLPYLEILDLSHTKVNLENFAIDFSKLVKLKYLDFSFSQIQFKISIFTGLNSLQELKVAGNTFKKDIFGQMFSNLTSLMILDISSCAIEDIPWNSFEGLHHLKHLAVSGNRLGTLNFLTHPSLSNLVSIYADGNNIFTISPSIFHQLSSNLLQFDLSFNPIECSCSSFEFISWIINHQSVLKNPDQLSCKGSLESSKVLDFDPTHCIHIKRVIFLLPIFAVVMSLLLSVLVYKFQFHLRYCFILLRGYRTASTQDYSYDAFVIYSSKDDVWVQDELKENLETGFPPVQLCLHERDFQAGKAITANIVDEGIMSSRKVIVVVSQHFIDSSWCRFEFEMAQSWFVLGQSARIILIILEDVEDKNIRKVFGLHKYLKKNTYLKWKGNALSNMRFWTRLRKAIIANE